MLTWWCWWGWNLRQSWYAPLIRCHVEGPIHHSQSKLAGSNCNASHQQYSTTSRLTLDSSTGVISGIQSAKILDPVFHSIQHPIRELDRLNRIPDYSFCSTTSSPNSDYAGSSHARQPPSRFHRVVYDQNDGSRYTAGPACNSGIPLTVPGMENASNTWNSYDLLVTKQSVHGVYQWVHVIENWYGNNNSYRSHLYANDLVLNANGMPLLLMSMPQHYGEIAFDRSRSHNIQSSDRTHRSLALVQFDGPVTLIDWVYATNITHCSGLWIGGKQYHTYARELVMH